MAKIRFKTEGSRDASSDLSRLVTAWLEGLDITGLFQTCVTCQHLGDGGKSCKKFPGYPIPAHIVVTGCEKYADREGIDDDIPF